MDDLIIGTQNKGAYVVFGRDTRLGNFPAHFDAGLRRQYRLALREEQPEQGVADP
jgi:hypothetical protein